MFQEVLMVVPGGSNGGSRWLKYTDLVANLLWIIFHYNRFSPYPMMCPLHPSAAAPSFAMIS